MGYTNAQGWHQANVGNSGTLVKSGSTRVYSAHIRCVAGSIRFCNFFNAASADDVTAGTTPADYVISATGATGASYEFPGGMYFPLGLVVTYTTAADGSGAAEANTVSLSVE